MGQWFIFQGLKYVNHIIWFSFNYWSKVKFEAKIHARATGELSSWDEIIPFYSEVSLAVYAFWLGWDFNLGWTHPCQIFILGWKKEPMMCKHFIQGWNFTMSMLLLKFWRMCSIFFPTLTCLNIIKLEETWYRTFL